MYPFALVEAQSYRAVQRNCHDIFNYPGAGQCWIVRGKLCSYRAPPVTFVMLDGLHGLHAFRELRRRRFDFSCEMQRREYMSRLNIFVASSDIEGCNIAPSELPRVDFVFLIV